MPDVSSKGNIAIALMVIILIGIVAGVYLVQRTQNFKPKAYSNPGQALKVISGSSDKPLTFDEQSNSFQSDSKSVKIKLEPETLENLKKAE